MFTQIITMFTQYFKECQPFLLTFTILFSKSWHRLHEPLKDEWKLIIKQQLGIENNKGLLNGTMLNSE